MLDRMLQNELALETIAVARPFATAGAAACTFGTTGTTGSGAEQVVTAAAYVNDNSLVARLAGSWSAIARKSMVPAFHDRWPLCST